MSEMNEKGKNRTDTHTQNQRRGKEQQKTKYKSRFFTHAHTQDTLTHTSMHAYVQIQTQNPYAQKLCMLHTECPDAYWMRKTMNANVRITRSFRVCSTFQWWMSERARISRTHNILCHRQKARTRDKKWHKQWKLVYNLQCDISSWKSCSKIIFFVNVHFFLHYLYSHVCMSA